MTGMVDALLQSITPDQDRRTRDGSAKESLPALDALLGVLADRIAERVVDKLRAGNLDGYVDQAASPLGRRRHIDAIRAGALPGIQVGRRYLALRKDVEEYIAKTTVTKTKRPAFKPKASSIGDLERELGLVKKTA